MSATVLFLDDAQLLAECEVHTYRASGPGGQKRNKVESAVRIVHPGLGISAIAEESRSQHDNRRVALRRLREAIALRVRSPVDLNSFVLPNAIQQLESPSGRLRISRRNKSYPQAVAVLLDVLAACGGRISKATAHLGISTGCLNRFLGEHPAVFQQANHIRRQYGLKPLRHSY